MTPADDLRPDPESLLRQIQGDEEHVGKGKLKIFFGMCAGVGKTYDMLRSAHEAKSKGVDVVIGYVETHRRPETEALTAGLPLVPRKQVVYKGTTLEEMDLDSILARKPQLVLVDELAHTNAPGSRHTKRFLDVQELIEHGIDVYTTLNVQHLESRADTVAQITGTTIRESIPDSIFTQADSIEIIDIPPDELQRRLAEGKVYTAERSQRAIENFFRKGNLTALREMALRLVAERVDHQLRDFMRTQRIAGPWKSGQRLLVAISPSPNTVKLIRWARRTAYTMDASWIGVYVETSASISMSAKDQLAKNLKLARELGAEIVTTADEDIARAILRVAREQNVTQILVGKSDWRWLSSRSLLDRLIDQSGDLDIYIVGGEQGEKKGKRRLSLPQRHSGLRQYAAAFFAVGLVALACFIFGTHLGYQVVALILLFTIVLLPLKLGVGPVLFAAGLSAVAWNFLFIPPRFTFAIGAPQDVLMFAMYFSTAAVTGVLTARIRAREKAVRSREKRASSLYAITRDLSLARSQDEAVRVAVEHLRKQFDAEVIVLLSQADGDVFTSPHPASTLTIDAKEFGAAAWVYWNEKVAGRFTETLPFAQATYYPLSGPRYPLGVVGIKIPQAKPLTIEQETLLQNFLSQLASTLEREQLNELAKQSTVLAESEKLYKTLFNSISHELRTPVAAILGAVEGLQQDAIAAREGKIGVLAGEIQTASERLNRLVENLLDITRLESGLVHAKLDWCDIHDVVGSACKAVRSQMTQHHLVVEIPQDAPLVKMDFGLVEQALFNLLVNASLYTPAGSTVRVGASVEDGNLIVAVSDNGPGIPKEHLERVFDKFYRIPGGRAGGTGLGLSIARGFVEAHKGRISVENLPEGGARFTLRLPVETKPIELEAEGRV